MGCTPLSRGAECTVESSAFHQHHHHPRGATLLRPLSTPGVNTFYCAVVKWIGLSAPDPPVCFASTASAQGIVGPGLGGGSISLSLLGSCESWCGSALKDHGNTASETNGQPHRIRATALTSQARLPDEPGGASHPWTFPTSFPLYRANHDCALRCPCNLATWTRTGEIGAELGLQCRYWASLATCQTGDDVSQPLMAPVTTRPRQHEAPAGAARLSCCAAQPVLHSAILIHSARDQVEFRAVQCAVCSVCSMLRIAQKAIPNTHLARLALAVRPPSSASWQAACSKSRPPVSPGGLSASSSTLDLGKNRRKTADK